MHHRRSALIHDVRFRHVEEVSLALRADSREKVVGYYVEHTCEKHILRVSMEILTFIGFLYRCVSHWTLPFV